MTSRDYPDQTRRRGRMARTGRAGFTLIEVLLAMGILAIGLSMIALAFPAGMQQSRITIDQTMGMIIGENALAICQAKLRPSDVPSDSFENLTDRIDPSDTAYPVETETPLVEDSAAPPFYRWMVWGRHVDADRSADVQLIIVPYTTFEVDKDHLDDIVKVHSVDDCTLTGARLSNGDPSGVGRLRVPGGGNMIHIGSPVIDRATGRYATIVGVDPDNETCRLRGYLGEDDTYDVLIFGSPDDGAFRGGKSPVLGALVVRTALRN